MGFILFFYFSYSEYYCFIDLKRNMEKLMYDKKKYEKSPTL